MLPILPYALLASAALTAAAAVEPRQGGLDLTFYADPNFGGSSNGFGANPGGCTSTGNTGASSIRTSWACTYFVEAGCGGASATFRGDIPNLNRVIATDSRNLDDRISSFKCINI